MHCIVLAKLDTLRLQYLRRFGGSGCSGFWQVLALVQRVRETFIIKHTTHHLTRGPWLP